MYVLLFSVEPQATPCLPPSLAAAEKSERKRSKKEKKLKTAESIEEVDHSMAVDTPGEMM